MAPMVEDGAQLGESEPSSELHGCHYIQQDPGVNVVAHLRCSLEVTHLKSVS